MTAAMNGSVYQLSYGYERITSTGNWWAYDPLGSVLPTSTFPSAPNQYDPYGAPANQPPYPTWSNWTYRAEWALADHLHLRNRDYDHHTGQFLTRDPLDGVPGTTAETNPYHYVYNDPLNRVDPSGLRPAEAVRQHEDFRFNPRPGYGQVKLNLFIQADYPPGTPIPGYRPEGNDRGFDETASIADSKFSLHLDYESGRGSVDVNYTCWDLSWGESSVTKCYDAYRLDVQKGDYYSCYYFDDCLPGSDARNSVDIYTDSPGLVFMYRVQIAGSPLPSPSINGQFEFLPQPDSDVVQMCWDRDPFPSLEAYQFVNGQHRVLARRDELTKDHVVPGGAPIALMDGHGDQGCSA